jgi:hypothetical protein
VPQTSPPAKTTWVPTVPTSIRARFGQVPRRPRTGRIVVDIDGRAEHRVDIFTAHPAREQHLAADRGDRLQNDLAGIVWLELIAFETSTRLSSLR